MIFTSILLLMMVNGASFTQFKMLRGSETNYTEQDVLREEDLEYPRGNPNILDALRRKWDKYYACLREREDEVKKPEIRRLLEGQYTELPCDICPRPFQDYEELEWKYKPLTPGLHITQLDHLDLTSEMKYTSTKTLQIFNADESVAGHYVCFHKASVVSVYILEVSKNDSMERVEFTQFHSNYTIEKEQRHFVINYQWLEWTECSACGRVGRKFKYGTCFVSKEKNSQESKEPQSSVPKEQQSSEPKEKSSKAKKKSSKVKEKSSKAKKKSPKAKEKSSKAKEKSPEPKEKSSAPKEPNLEPKKEQSSKLQEYNNTPPTNKTRRRRKLTYSESWTDVDLTSSKKFMQQNIFKKLKEKIHNSNSTSEATNDQQWDSDILNKFSTGIPCASPHLPKLGFEMLRKIKAVRVLVPCPGNEIFEVFDESGKLIEWANNTAGIYSMFQKIPQLPPDIERWTIEADFGTDVIIRCPGNSLSNIPVTWKVNNKIIFPHIIQNQSNGRFTIDLIQRIHLKRLRRKDSNIYSCWQRNKLVGTVHLNVEKKFKIGFDHHVTLLGIAAVVGTFVFVGSKILAREIKMRKK